MDSFNIEKAEEGLNQAKARARGSDIGWGAPTVPSVRTVRKWLAFAQIRLSELGAIKKMDWTTAHQEQVALEAFNCEMMERYIKEHGGNVPTMKESLALANLSIGGWA